MTKLSQSLQSNAQNKLLDDASIAKIVQLLQPYAPERIILFGSRARDTADEYSDYDLVVIKRTSRSFLTRLQDMIPYLVAFGCQADILVYTPEEFEQLRETGFGCQVHQEGVILYERPTN